MGTLFVPQARSTAEVPHPLATAFLKAVAVNTHYDLLCTQIFGI